MQRNTPERDRDPRRNAERDAAQPMAGQPRSEDDDESLQKPEDVPSFLTARELQARDPAKGSGDKEKGGDRHANAGFSHTGTGGEGEPTISDDEPPRGDRGMPMDRTDRMLRKGSQGKPK